MNSSKGIFDKLTYDADRGAIVLNGVRYMLIRPETIAGFQREVERTLGEKAAALLYKGGFEGGSRSAAKLKAGGLTPEQTLRAMCEMGAQIGWGAFAVLKFDASEFEIAVAASPYAEAYGKSERPVCHFTAGVFGGVAGVIYANDVRVVETECAAAGAAVCKFSTVK